MLAHQLTAWAAYPAEVRQHFRFVIVDDCSTQPCDALLHHYPAPENTALYRIDTDIPWNQHGARNLAAQQATTDWLLMLDIDHVLTAENAARLVRAMHYVPAAAHGWFKFPRERIGAEDETRTKDSRLRRIDPTISRVPVNSAMNCFLVTRDAYWRAGGYNEDFCGTYGGDSQFLNYLRDEAGEPATINDVWLQVHTRHSVPDANTVGLDRSPEEFRRRLAAAREAGTVRGHAPYCRFEWRRVL
jgi:hypothetical protein